MQCSQFTPIQKNIVPSPSCSCGDFESAYHFFFICPNYSNVRNLYLPSNLHDLNTHQLLNGKPDVPGSDNERLFCKYMILSCTREDLFSTLLYFCMTYLSPTSPTPNSLDLEKRKRRVGKFAKKTTTKNKTKKKHVPNARRAHSAT